MKTETMTFRKIMLTGIYVVVIFSILALIRSQNKQLLSKEVRKTSEVSTVGVV